MDRMCGHTDQCPTAETREMQSDELTRALVMAAIADDYEDFKMIADEVTRWTKERGLKVNPSEIHGHLTKLINDGLAKAYRLSQKLGAKEIPPPSLEDMSTDIYFFLTSEGKRSVLPIDDL